ncbi:hypothetical protein K8R42_03085 [bacterium]|nr:hypothetical protein [bacterium]
MANKLSAEQGKVMDIIRRIRAAGGQATAARVVQQSPDFAIGYKRARSCMEGLVDSGHLIQRGVSFFINEDD